MALPNTNALLFNGAGAALFLFLGAYMLRPVFVSNEVAACSERYPSGHRFALENAAGAALTPIELQGRAGLREYGILANASVQPTPDAQWGKSLVVKMAAAKSGDASRFGAGYTWPVSAMKSAEAACLTYNVFLSDDVDMKTPAKLPGLLAASLLPNRTSVEGFAARLGWQNSPTVGVGVEYVARDRSTDSLESARREEWPRGRWVRVEQEVELGAVQNSGVVRVWLDGKLAIEGKDMNLRADADTRFAGVAGDTGYLQPGGRVAAVKVSPFVVQWR